MTADAHPIHLHLTQYQILSRQPFLNVGCYETQYINAYGPGSTIDSIAAQGPPYDYNSTPKLGGNLDVKSRSPTRRMGPSKPPPPSEQGSKAHGGMYPDEVTRIAVRARPPTSTADNADQLAMPSTPTTATAMCGTAHH